MMAICDRIITIFDGRITVKIKRKEIKNEEEYRMQSKGAKDPLQLSQYMVYIVLAVVFVLFTIVLNNKGFATPQNLLNILRQTGP